MGKSSAPAAPDPYAAASAQYQFGTEAGQFSNAMNQVNQQNPFYSQNTQVSSWQPIYGPGSGGTPYTSMPSASPGGTPSNPMAYEEQGASGTPYGSTPAATPAAAGGPTHVARNMSPYNGAGGAAGVGPPPGVTGPPSGGYAPRYTTTTQLTAPEEQGVQAAQGQAAGLISAGEPNIAPVQTQVGPYAGLEFGLNQGPGGGAEGQVLAAGMAAADPMMSAQYEQLDASLRNSGNPPGSPAYNQAMSQLQAQQGGQEAQIEGAAAQAGTQEQMAANQAAGQSYQEALSNAGFANTAGQTQLAEYGEEVGQPLQELAAYEGMLPGGAGGTAGGAGGASVAAPDIMQAFQNQYQGQLAQYNANVGTQNSELSDVASLAAAFIMA